MNRRLRGLVYEGACGGHRLKWCATVARALAEVGLDVTLLLPSVAPQHPLFEDWIKPLPAGIVVESVLSEQGPGLRGRLSQVRSLRDHVLRISPDRLYFPMFDGVAQSLAVARWLGYWPPSRGLAVEGLLMGAGILEEPKGFLDLVRRQLSFALAKSSGAESLFHLNPAVREYELSHGRASGEAVRTMPELVFPRQGLSRLQARSKLGLPEQARIVGMVGGLNHRKGADIAVRAFVDGSQDNDYLLMAGLVDPGVREAFQEAHSSPAGPRIIVIDRILAEEEFACAIDSLDLMFLPYRMTAPSSGVVLEAAARGCPILASAGGFAEQANQRARLGWILPSLERAEVTSTLRVVLSQCRDYQPDETTSAFLSYQTPANFAAHWTRGARRALGLPDDKTYVPWSEL